MIPRWLDRSLGIDKTVTQRVKYVTFPSIESHPIHWIQDRSGRRKWTSSKPTIPGRYYWTVCLIPGCKP